MNPHSKVQNYTAVSSSKNSLEFVLNDCWESVCSVCSLDIVEGFPSTHRCLDPSPETGGEINLSDPWWLSPIRANDASSTSSLGVKSLRISDSSCVSLFFFSWCNSKTNKYLIKMLQKNGSDIHTRCNTSHKNSTLSDTFFLCAFFFFISGFVCTFYCLHTITWVGMTFDWFFCFTRFHVKQWCWFLLLLAVFLV